ncbi:Acetylornithine deacetylase/Succinyl-diaminopimelate desuccinylase [Paenibacillus sp. 1_12]|uniref:dipeptidase n=1 Tax=Paenibacillus sp. 1_12 TaxID=1566278 RepID=UPI0008ED0858|nr:dipeptidase [Paenibacillus sp. 1_12]SFL58503.1 Acetylornithine deacetylase/Succinyl-diaminopimelate desuccinylase [Paenibacillus sp. 1_12]
MTFQSYFENRKEQHMQELKEWLSIPSISALSVNKPDVCRAAEWLSEALKRAGLENVSIHETKGHPVVYADYVRGEDKPTVLVYGHYDVQPVDPLGLWETPPFEPTVRDGKLYARGATDDKGQLFLHIKAVEAFLEQGLPLPVNIKFCVEGEEEIGSPHLPSFLEQNRELFAADYVLISDTSLLEKGRPAISTGLRGLCSLEVAVTSARTDLHSGSYGGGVPNALHAIAALLTSLHDEQGRVTVAGFYDDVPELSDLDREEFAKLAFDEEKLKQELGLDELYGEEGYSFVERVGARPTLEVNGLYGGFQGEGTKTVIPRVATAKITSRLVGTQNPQDILDKVERHLKAHIQSGATVTVTQLERGNPFTMNPATPVLQKAADAYERVYGVRPVFTKDGGSIPIVEAFSRLLDVPVVLMGFGLPDENLHAPNEHFNLENFDLGLLTITTFLQLLSESKN